MAKFVFNIFLVAIFDATFADQMLKSDTFVLTPTIFWKMNVWAFKKKNKNQKKKKKKKKRKSGKTWLQNEPWICHLGCHLGFNKIPQSDIIIFYSIYRWWNVHKRGILWIVKHGDGQIRNWHICGSHLRCHVEFLEKPKGDKVASISFFKERSSAIKTVKTFCIYRQSRFTKIMLIICLQVIPAGLIIRIVKEMLSGGGIARLPPHTHTPHARGVTT